MTSDWRRLADAVVRRRAELKLTQGDLAERAGISVDRIQAIEGARRDRYRRTTLAAIEPALAWKGGSVEAVLAGGEPSAIGSSAGEPSARELAAEVRKQLRDLRSALEEQMGDRNRAARDALIGGLEALVEESTANRPGR